MSNILKYSLLFVISMIWFGCNEGVTDSLMENQPPDTHLFLLPESEISQQQSKLKVHWWGDDPDGLVTGFYFTWDNQHWSFCPGNDSTFALMIGASDTIYNFRVASVDNSGNGVYDNSVERNGISLGAEPFLDANNDKVYNSGETFFDIGSMDPTPAVLKFPIKNSAPVIQWNALTVLPEISFPVMTLGFDVADVDGDETVQYIRLALNDTTKPLTLPGNVRKVMIRLKDYESSSSMEVLLNASENSIFSEKLQGLKLNDDNTLYVQAEDISGAKSSFIALKKTNGKWLVKKPAGKVLIIDDNKLSDNSAAYYTKVFNEMNGGALAGKYDVWDLKQNAVPYESSTFLETIKLFKYIFWYSDGSPSLELASTAVRKFLNLGGKIAFSMQFGSTVDMDAVRAFLPVDSLGTTKGINYSDKIYVNTVIKSVSSGYPELKSTATITNPHSVYSEVSTTQPVYESETTRIKDFKRIGFIDNSKKLFYIGLPLFSLDGNSNVGQLLSHVFFDEFNLTP